MGLSKQDLFDHLDRIECADGCSRDDVDYSRGVVVGLYQSMNLLKKKRDEIRDILVSKEFTDSEKLKLIDDIAFDRF